MIFEILMIVSLSALFIIYGGYALLLWIADSMVGAYKNIRKLSFPQKANPPNFSPPISVYMAVKDEGTVIKGRLDNLLSTDYPIDSLELIIISDGSVDNTVTVCHSFFEKRRDVKYKVIEWKASRGRAAVQNEVARIATNDILVATDADTIFNKDTLRKLVEPFVSDDIAVVGGIVEYRADGNSNSPISESYGKYRGMERMIRDLETRLGVMVKVDGPCLAYKKSIWSELKDYEDVDQVITLLARKGGYRSVQANYAYCTDKANQNNRQEIIQRARMTRKAFLSISNQWGWREIYHYPYFSLALFLHKILRFFSPVFVLMLMVSCIPAFTNTLFCLVIGVVVLLALTLSNLRRIGMSFVIAQIGFTMGLILWVRGVKEGRYKPTRHLDDS